MLYNEYSITLNKVEQNVRSEMYVHESIKDKHIYQTIVC